MGFIKKVFEVLNNEIKYCHFKSNEHLSDSFNGGTDFDLLIHQCDTYKLQISLLKLGFKRRESTPNKLYPGMEDYIGFDKESGCLYHFHIHYQLIFGKKLSKNYVFNTDNKFWSLVIFNKDFNIYILPPEIELLILIIRVSLKTEISFKNIAKVILYRNILPNNIINELDYLFTLVNENTFKNQCSLFDINHKTIHNLYYLFKTKNYRSAKLLTSKASIEKSLCGSHVYKKQTKNRIFKIRKLASVYSGSWLPSVGTSIAFIGSDGSGKSSIVKVITKWLSWKLTVQNFYMGKPKFYPRKINILFKLISIARILNFHSLAVYIKEIRHLYNARLRFSNYNNSKTLTRSGSIVIFDRYPLVDFSSMETPMDGPRIKGNTYHARKEGALYNNIKEPAIIIILEVEVKESLKRKQNQGIVEDQDVLKNKYEAIKELIHQRHNQDNIFVVNTMKPFKEVIIEVKNIIWNRI